MRKIRYSVCHSYVNDQNNLFTINTVQFVDFILNPFTFG